MSFRHNCRCSISGLILLMSPSLKILTVFSLFTRPTTHPRTRSPDRLVAYHVGNIAQPQRFEIALQLTIFMYPDTLADQDGQQPFAYQLHLVSDALEISDYQNSSEPVIESAFPIVHGVGYYFEGARRTIRPESVPFCIDSVRCFPSQRSCPEGNQPQPFNHFFERCLIVKAMNIIGRGKMPHLLGHVECNYVKYGESWKRSDEWIDTCEIPWY